MKQPKRLDVTLTALVISMIPFIGSCTESEPEQSCYMAPFLLQAIGVSGAEQRDIGPCSDDTPEKCVWPDDLNIGSLTGETVWYCEKHRSHCDGGTRPWRWTGEQWER
jgi:hypothetical protein